MAFPTSRIGLNFLFLLIAFCSSPPATAKTLTIATASNFHSTLLKLVESFHKLNPSVRINISSGSSGSLYTRISMGAPYDLFFSADVDTPKRLDGQGLVKKNTRFTYAYGRLAFWAPGDNAKISVREMIEKHQGKLVIANPKIAPYGKAAEQLLKLYSKDSKKYQLVVAENVVQAHQYIKGGSVVAGFVSYSQLLLRGGQARGYIAVFDDKQLEQQVVLLSRSREVELALEFLRFIQSDGARKIIEDSGYRLPKAGGDV
ncbi:MAG: molybdate ABC transporter substrate-binding protein [Gammaproteobacteria bacterium]|nr:molybdate ABC transporter substrate-binding protein [Gammaproteobacteria bacterium]